MLYESLSQPIIFLFLSLSGFLSGFLFDLKNILSIYFRRNKIISQILLFFAVFLTFFICFFINLKINYGEFRFFSIVAFAISFILQRLIVKNFLAKPVIKCYNKLKEKHNGRKTKMVEKT